MLKPSTAKRLGQLLLFISEAFRLLLGCTLAMVSSHALLPKSAIAQSKPIETPSAATSIPPRGNIALDFNFSHPFETPNPTLLASGNHGAFTESSSSDAKAGLTSEGFPGSTAFEGLNAVPRYLTGLAALPLDHIFAGNSDSLVARTIGAAEGTRSPDGSKTWAYGGHTDPGNGVWNLGTFSWQHGASSPEEADRKQLERLRKQAAVLTRKAEAAGIPWGLEEQLNALDLANQSPSAALNAGGYIDRLQQAQANGLQGAEAILWARTWSYRHPSGTRWNAPGLGNTHHGIRTDQKRRQDAIRDAVAAFMGMDAKSDVNATVKGDVNHVVRGALASPSPWEIAPITQKAPLLEVFELRGLTTL